MLDDRELAALYRRLGDQGVLSVYLDADEHDPANRTAWRRRLIHLAARARISTDEASGERELFDHALSRVHSELRAFDAFLPDRGWIAFASPDRLWYAETVPVPVPDVVWWGAGIRVAPYIRGLKQNRPVAAILLDRRRARLFRYRAGVLSEPVDMVAAVLPADVSDIGTSKRARTHSGFRGVTRTDTVRRSIETGAERLLKDCLGKALKLAGEHGLLVLGGTPEMVAAAARRLPKATAGRVVELPSLHVEMPSAALAAALESTASAHSRDRQNALLEEVVDRARSHGHGCLGRKDTEDALREGGVETLVFSRHFREREPDLADRYVGSALVQGANVEEIAGPGADLLDTEGDGIGARLRFQIRTDEADTVRQ